MKREETLNHVRSKQNIIKVKGPGKNRVTYGVDRKRRAIIYNDEAKGLDEAKGRRVEILPTDGVV
jgi:hypothetical protein